MDPASKPAEKNSSLKVGVGVIAVIIVVVLVALGYAFHKHSSNNSSANSLPSGWIEYKATKYGFKFDYPKEWSSPQLMTYNSPTKAYSIVFSSNNQVPYTVVASMQSSTPTDHLLKKKGILTALSESNKNYVKYDSSSYATLSVDPASHIAGQLNIFQIVNLPKLSVSAVSTEVMVDPQKNCTSSQLTNNDQSGCLSNTMYNNASRFSKSISPL